MTQHNPLLYLTDMRDACRRIERYTAGVPWESFLENDKRPLTASRLRRPACAPPPVGCLGIHSR